MTIKSIEAIPVSLPMLKPVIMAGEEVRRADNMLIRIETRAGLVGWGEAASAPTMTGETTESMVAAAQYMSAVLLGRDADDIAGAIAAMDTRMYGNHGAKAAIEIALHDLTGQASGKPVHALLGEKRRERAAILGVIGGGDHEGDLADAAKKKKAGFTLFKVKVGVDTADKDAARTRDVCGVLGAGHIISADANQGFSAVEGLAFVRALQGGGLDFFEQPVRAEDIDSMAAIAAATDIAIGADEGIHSTDDIRRHHALKAARGVSLKAIKLGGLIALAEASRLCDSLGMQVNIACKTGESSIACAAALHVAAVIPNIAWGLTLTNGALGADVTREPVRIDNGHALVLDRPGLGIAVDEDAVRRHRIDRAARPAA